MAPQNLLLRIATSLATLIDIAVEFDVFKANHGAAKREILCAEHVPPHRLYYCAGSAGGEAALCVDKGLGL